MAIRKELLDELLAGYQEPEDLMGENGVLQQLTKALIERVLEGEMTHHLGYEKHSPEGKNTGNSRNGKTSKTLKGKQGAKCRVIAKVSSSRSSFRSARRALTDLTTRSLLSMPAA